MHAKVAGLPCLISFNCNSILIIEERVGLGRDIGFHAISSCLGHVTRSWWPKHAVAVGTRANRSFG